MGEAKSFCRIKSEGKLDDDGGNEVNSGNGQIMAYMNEPRGRDCDWGFLRSECYSVRLPIDYEGEIPAHMILKDVEEADYLVFEHGLLIMNKKTEVLKIR